MPKLKTKKSVAKRFKITATGKAMRHHNSRAHLMRKKNAKRRRRLRLEAAARGADMKRVRAAMPYSF